MTKQALAHALVLYNIDSVFLRFCHLCLFVSLWLCLYVAFTLFLSVCISLLPGEIPILQEQQWRCHIWRGKWCIWNDKENVTWPLG